MQETIDDLRAELRKLRHVASSDVFRNISNIHAASSFMKVLPIEIRLKVYKLLLLNSQLGQALWIGTNTSFGATFKYGLLPNILGVCRAINDEAEGILYGMNTFIFVSHRRVGGEISWLPQCPLTRYFDRTAYPAFSPKYSPGDDFDFDIVPSLKSVKRWHIVSASSGGFRNDGLSRTLATFCQKICASSLRDLTLTWIASKKEASQIATCEAELKD